MLSKNFWSEKKAKAFAATLEAQGAESVKIWSERDTINNCTRYIVKWYF